VTAEQLKSLYDCGEITLKLFSSSSAEAAGGYTARCPSAPSRIPRAVKKLWPFFVFGAPLVGPDRRFSDSTTGNAFVESNISGLTCPHRAELLAVAYGWLLISIESEKITAQGRGMRSG